MEYFYPTPYIVMMRKIDNLFKYVSPERCAENCLRETSFICKSFDYHVGCFSFGVYVRLLTPIRCPIVLFFSDVNLIVLRLIFVFTMSSLIDNIVNSMIVYNISN